MGKVLPIQMVNSFHMIDKTSSEIIPKWLKFNLTYVTLFTKQLYKTITTDHLKNIKNLPEANSYLKIWCIKFWSKIGQIKTPSIDKKILSMGKKILSMDKKILSMDKKIFPWIKRFYPWIKFLSVRFYPWIKSLYPWVKSLYP